MKWPVIEQYTERGVKIIKTTFLTKVTEIGYDTATCKACKQCARVCPHEAWVMPVIPRGTKVEFVERMPLMPDPAKCVFCGLCLALCPYDSIIMTVDGHLLHKADLQLVKANALPVMEKVKVGKVELPAGEETSTAATSAFWAGILDRISLKKKKVA